MADCVCPELYEMLERRWKNSLVGKFLQDPPPLYVLRRWANKLWGRDGQVRVSLLYDRMLLIQLPNQKVCDWILENGPWFHFNNLLYLRPWTPGISVEDLGRKALPIWVHFANVPLEYNDYQGLSRIASWIGVPLGVDHTTRMGDRHGYAKVLVELTVDSECPDHVLLWPDDDSSLRIGITYCNLPPICSKCHLFGIIGECTKHQGHQQGQKWVPNQVNLVISITEKVQSAKLDVPVVVQDQTVGNGNGKEVVLYDADPQLSAIIPELAGTSQIPLNLEKSFQDVASSPKLPTVDEFQMVVNGAKPRIWSPQSSPQIQTTSAFTALSKLDENNIIKVQAAPKKKDGKKEVKKGGGKPSSSK
ncbi:unnamed protein product [Linum trigynum]|uniref:DUF4283 domain-containing protein n=1 Tax=Linum trigynum TaxID=586398 RepID=A0AAV2DCW7_9ROSI